jgi:uncharacterized protein (TIGR02145 family)
MGKRVLTYALILGTMLVLARSCQKDNSSSGPVTDIEGNVYKTVTIGNQVWMEENLKTTRFNDGTDIPLITNNTNWAALTTPGYSCYNNDAATNKDVYGSLYNGYTIITGKLCPAGWHIPSREDWQQLMEFLGDTTKGGGKLKESGITHWSGPNKGADNSAGFTALPSGIRYFDGSFASMSYFTAIWTASEAGTDNLWYVGLYYGDPSVNINQRSKKHGFSVRCIKD